MLGVVRVGPQLGRQTAFLGDQGSVDVRDAALHHRTERALERPQFQGRDVMPADLPAYTHLEQLGEAPGGRREETPQPLGQEQPRGELVVHRTQPDIHRLRDEPAGQRLPHGLGHRHARALLRLHGARAQMRGDHHVVQLEQR